jgi:hypothetical protein
MKRFFSNKFSFPKIIFGGIALIGAFAVSILYWRIVLPAAIIGLIIFGIVRGVQRYNRWIIWKATGAASPFPGSSWLGIRISFVNIVLSVMLVISITASIVHITHATAPNPGHNFTEVGGGILQGQLLYGSAPDTLSALPINTSSTSYLSNTGPSNNPAWAQINLTNGVTGALPPANGGTGIANGSNNTFTFSGGNFSLGVTLSGNTTLTFPTTGTVTALGNATTGSGSIVLATSPVLTSPTLGAASVTTINGLTPTSQSTGFTLAGGTTPATLTVTGNATISGTPLANPMTSVGDMIDGGASGVPTRLAVGATTGMILMNTASTAPSWTLLSGLPSTAGALLVANGGTGLATLTANGVMLGAGTGSPTFVTTSTAGALLESNGTTWVAAQGGVLINQQVLTSGTTYTPTTGTTHIIIQMWGGGGAGGSCTAAAGCASGGGGSGGYAYYYLTGVTGTYAYTIGTAGAAVAGAAGGNGGNTTFVNGGTTVTAYGGTGGGFTAGSSATKYTAGGAGGIVSTNGTINAAGVPGGWGSTSATATIGATGSGGSTSLGGGGVGKVYSSAAAVAGVAAVANTGSGGSGGGTGTTTVAAGGAGAAGIIIIWEYR